MVPLAVDAGLGEMGRLGYLLTKKLEPRVRLGAVTTTLPLLPDRPVDIGVADFYRICKKCATCCPSASMSASSCSTPSASSPSSNAGLVIWPPGLPRLSM